MSNFVERRIKKDPRRSGARSQFQNPTEERRSEDFIRRVMDRACLKNSRPVRQRLEFAEAD